MSFLTQLDRSSHPVVQKLVCQHILLGNTRCLKQVSRSPRTTTAAPVGTGQGQRVLHVDPEKSSSSSWSLEPPSSGHKDPKMTPSLIVLVLFPAANPGAPGSDLRGGAGLLGPPGGGGASSGSQLRPHPLGQAEPPRPGPSGVCRVGSSEPEIFRLFPPPQRDFVCPGLTRC